MKSGIKYLLIGIAATLIAGGGFYIYKNYFTIDNKEGAINYLHHNGYLWSKKTARSFDEPYLIAWAKAVRDGAKTFKVGEETKIHDSKTGKVVTGK